MQTLPGDNTLFREAQTAITRLQLFPPKIAWTGRDNGIYYCFSLSSGLMHDFFCESDKSLYSQCLFASLHIGLVLNAERRSFSRWVRRLWLYPFRILLPSISSSADKKLFRPLGLHLGGWQTCCKTCETFHRQPKKRSWRLPPSTTHASVYK